MAHRRLFHVPQIPERDNAQSWNHPRPNPHMHFENGIFVLPTDGAANAISRPSVYPSIFPSYTTANSGPLYDPCLRPSLTVSSTRFIPDQVRQVLPSNFNQHGSSMVNPQAEIRSEGLKRKSPSMPLAFDGGNTSGYYCAGSSSNLHISNNQLQTKPLMGPQQWPLDPASTIHGYRSDIPLTAGEGSQRNVRSRHGHGPHMEINLAVSYSSSNPTHNFCSTGNVSGLSMAGQWSHTPTPIAPQGRILSADDGPNHEIYQSLSGSSVSNETVGINGAYHPNLSHVRNPNAFLPALHGPSTQGFAVGSSSYNQRSNSSGANPSYPHVRFATPLENIGPSRTESIASTRYNRPLSMEGHNSYRNGRARQSYSRFQPIYGEDNVRNRWLPEGAVTIDQSTFYDSGNFFDEHRDMRLDIDNMSYEELLALEERIGNVSTGLSEETTSRCLTETSYSSCNQNGDDQEDRRCVICLDAYEDRDNLGRLNCGHDFHVSCIKDWLQRKNACPICKAAAFSDTGKEKQT